MRGLGSLTVFIVGTIFCAVGGFIALSFGKPLLDKAKASEQWPTTEGQIIESELERHRGSQSTTYSALVVYTYAVDGGEFESDRIWFGGDYSTSDRSEMSAVVKEFPVGKAVTVYVSPDDPAESVLMPGAFISSYLLYAISLAFAVIGGLMVAVIIIRIVLTIVSGPPGEDDFPTAVTTFGDLKENGLRSNEGLE